MICRYVLVSLWGILLGFSAFAVPGSLTYQGRIKNIHGEPLEINGVQFEFSITNPAGTCTLYREISSGIDMRNSNGVFDVPIGTGAKAFPGSASFKLLDSFDNSTTFNCESGGTYTPVADDKRLLRVQFFDGTGWRLITPDSEIRAVPFAGHARIAQSAQKLGIYTAADFVVKSALPLCGAGQYLRHIAPAGTFECASVTVNGSDVSGNISGSSAGFTGNLSGDVSGTQSATSVDKIQGVAVTMTGLASGKVLKYNGTQWAPADESGGTSLPSGTSAGQVLLYSGSQWEAQYFGMGQLRSSVTGATQIPASCATANKTLTWNAITDNFACTTISIANTQVTGLGTAAAKDFGTAAGNLVELDGGGKIPSALLPAGISQWTTTGSDIYYDAGRVGIGTNSPTARLNIVDNTNSATLRLQNLNSGNPVGIGFRGSDGNNKGYLEWANSTYNGGLSGPDALSLFTMGSAPLTLGTASLERLRIDSSGNVGVGTNNPQRRLHVRADGTYQLRLENGNTGGGYWNISQSDNVFGAGGGKLLFVPDNDASTAAAVTFTNSGDVGIGTTAPEAKLTLDVDGGIVAKGTTAGGRTLATAGAGTRMMWYPRKAAFRAGTVSSTQWDDANIGSYSTAMGYNTQASGSYSVALGAAATANNTQSSVAIGNTVTASGMHSAAIGADATATGSKAVALGNHVTAPSFSQISVGMYNAVSGSENATAVVATDPLFVIGNGTSSTPSNAVTVLKNGNVGIGTTTPTQTLDVNGKVRFGGRTIARTTVCSYYSTTINTDAGSNTAWHYWSGGECDNGLPQGSCVSYLAQAVASGNDSDWQVLNPGESPGYGVAGVPTNGGIHLTLTSPSAFFRLKAVYQCDQ